MAHLFFALPICSPKNHHIKNAEVIAPFVLLGSDRFGFQLRRAILIAQSQTRPSVSMSGLPRLKIASL
jgi:hypothetical protein